MGNSLFFILCLCSAVSFGQVNITVAPAMEVLKDFDKVRDFTMDASGSEAYFTIQSQTEDVSVISMSSKTGGQWGTPIIASYSGTYKDLEPFLAPDGLRLYFVSNRPLHDSISQTKDFDIWYVERLSKTTGWSQPINMGAPINSEHNEFYRQWPKTVISILRETAQNPRERTIYFLASPTMARIQNPFLWTTM